MQLGVVENLSYFTPEILLTVVIAAVILVDLTKPPPGSRLVSRLAATGLAATLFMLILTYAELELKQRTRVFLFADTFVVDPFGLFFKTVACVCAFESFAWNSLTMATRSRSGSLGGLSSLNPRWLSAR